MDFTERMLERNRSRYNKTETKESTSQTPAAPLKEIHRNTVTTTIASTSGGSTNKVTIETKVTMRKMPKVASESVNKSPKKEDKAPEPEVETETTSEEKENSTEKSHCQLRKDTKSRLQRLGVLYSDDPSRLSSPIHRTEERFVIEEPERREWENEREEVREVAAHRSGNSSARSARLAKLADTINHWEDDVRHHPVGSEAQGFSRSESSKRIIYDYDKDTPSGSQSPDRRSESPRKSVSPVKNTSPVRNFSPVKSTSPVKTFSPAKTTSPVKTTSTIKAVSPTKPTQSPNFRVSPTKGRYGSPIQMGTSVMKAKDYPVTQSSDEDTVAPTMGVKQLRSSPVKGSPLAGSVLDRAARYEEATSPTKRNREPDPAELPLSARLALFERNAGAAPVPLPKVPFGMSVPAKKLQTSHTDVRNLRTQPPRPAVTQPCPGANGSSALHDRLAKFEKGADNAEKKHMKEILSERQQEMEMLKHRWDRYKGTAEPEVSDYEPSAPPPTPPPLPSPPREFEYRRSSGFFCEPEHEDDYDMEEEEEDNIQKKDWKKEDDGGKAYPGLKEVKKVKLSPPKPGHLYPCLSDIEVESEVQDSEVGEYDNNRSSSSDTSNESDLHSLGQDIVKLSRSNLKRDWSVSESGNEEKVLNEIDDFLDEALAESSDEPTPPKRSSYLHNAGTVHSTSFEFSGRNEEEGDTKHTAPLLHTVSFYRKQQTMSLKPTSPVKHIQIDQGGYSSDDSVERLEAELDQELKMVEQKINMLQQEVMKQHTIISQTSQALNFCSASFGFSGSGEQLEAEKILLLATKRKQAAQMEIQRLKVEQTVRPKAPGNKSLTERGSLTLSNITVPLKMDVVHQAAKDDQCYHLVCLVQTDERVFCTKVMSAPKNLRNHNRITFPDTFTLDGLYSDFKVTLEVYTITGPIKEIIPHDIKYHINTSKKEASKLKLTPRKGKKDARLHVPAVQSPGGPMAVRSTSFSMAGYVIFSLREINRNQFTLNKNAYTSVLEGSMQLHIESEMSLDVEYRGFLTMFEDVSGFGAWHRRWCLLKGDKLSYWKYPDDERKKFALDTIELSTCTTDNVDVVPRDVCARPNTFLLETSRSARNTDVDSLVLIRKGNTTTIRHLLSADTKEDRIQWCLYLNKALALMRAWGVTPHKQ